MTTSSALVYYDVSDTTAFRLMGLTISNLIKASGVTWTADTGQINWATVSKPANNTMAGFEIYRMNDGFTEIYIRIEYWMGAASDRFRMRFSTGTATNGAGVLSNSAAAVDAGHTSYNALVGEYGPVYVCWTAGYFGFSAFEQTGGQRLSHIFWSLTRSSNSAGVYNNIGYHRYYATYGFPNLHSYTFALNFDHPITTYYSNLPTGLIATYDSSTVGTLRIQGYNKGLGLQYLPTLLGYSKYEIGKSAIFPCITEGATPKTFIAINMFSTNYSSEWFLAMLWQ